MYANFLLLTRYKLLTSIEVKFITSLLYTHWSLVTKLLVLLLYIHIMWNDEKRFKQWQRKVLWVCIIIIYTMYLYICSWLCSFKPFYTLVKVSSCLNYSWTNIFIMINKRNNIHKCTYGKTSLGCNTRRVVVWAK